MVQNKPINVTKPTLPPLEEFIPYLEEIWQLGILTNNGPFHQKLEQSLCHYLGVNYISLFANGALALVTALRALGIRGEVITTPFSFVATAHALEWSNNTPVFVDIDRETLNINPELIKSSINEHTAAIMPVHCYGNPCNVDAIEMIAAEYNLPVIYDGAHAFGVNCHCGSVLNHGDMTVLSFHATKVFTTFEGGAIVCPNENRKKQLDALKNFGFVDEITVLESGINGKMNELEAVIGLLQLNMIDDMIARRTTVASLYKKGLAGVAGITCVSDSGQLRSNHAYFPILVGPDFPISRDSLYERLKRGGINSRRYFYPLISELPMYCSLESASRKNLPVANEIAESVLCLPIYPDLAPEVISDIIQIIASVRR